MRSHPVWPRPHPRHWLALLTLLAASIGHAQADGSKKWEFRTSTTTIAGDILSSPAVAPDGTVYIGTEVGPSSSPNPAGRLFAIAPDGAQKWVFDAPDWIDSTPAIASDGTIYFGCWDGKLYALNPDRSPKWTCDLRTFISSSPALGADGTIYVGTGSGDLYAVNPDGGVKWFFPTLYWIEAAPAVAPDGTIYVGSGDNAIYAIHPDGTEKWHVSVGNDVASSPAIAADGTVYIGGRDLKLYALSPAGAVKWTFETTDMIDASPVLGADGTIYFATTGGRVYALRPDGTQKWQYPAPGQASLSSIYSTPAVRADGSIVFGSGDNAVYALKSDGTLLWKATLGDWADSSPCIAPDGTIYIGCTDKSLYAFHGASPLTMTDWPQLLRNPQRTGYQPLGAATGTTGRLLNLSVRTFAGAGDNTLMAGFYLGGSNTRDLLVRGVGPALAAFIGGVLPDPKMAFYPSGSGTPAFSNDNWGQNNTASATEISTLSNTLGAFALPPDSLDSAMLLRNFPAGGGSVQVTGVNGSTGIALLELYDAGGSSTARLINLSARSFVDTGAGVLIAGFVVDAGTRAVLIRGVGPTLAAAPFNLGGVLARPRLQVFRSANGHDTVVAENSGWSNATNAGAIATAGEALFAFPLAAGGADAAMLLTLPPGNYSCQLSGVNGTTGIGLIEVYEVK